MKRIRMLLAAAAAVGVLGGAAVAAPASATTKNYSASFNAFGYAWGTLGHYSFANGHVSNPVWDGAFCSSNCASHLVIAPVPATSTNVNIARVDTDFFLDNGNILCARALGDANGSTWQDTSCSAS